MAVTLFQRITGDTPDPPGPNEARIPVHEFFGLLTFVLDGEITAVQARDAMDLDAAQTTQAQWIITQAQAHAKPREFISWLFRSAILAEARSIPAIFNDEAAFTARIVAEVARNPAP